MQRIYHSAGNLPFSLNRFGVMSRYRFSVFVFCKVDTDDVGDELLSILSVCLFSEVPTLSSACVRAHADLARFLPLLEADFIRDAFPATIKQC
ncbi:hypothetical protein DPMN_044315 [Dreissena polymorpha]|uniref:Uncharacterized protein n=1 Tax=Dreissena polymorpha TaxID=45954 RepID=A0A9D4HYT6_DREPO|nr:hypothetical protein DPMN_044315 [Dreissena polymorpha]